MVLDYCLINLKDNEDRYSRANFNLLADNIQYIHEKYLDNSIIVKNFVLANLILYILIAILLIKFK